MTVLLISDVHANLQALEAVLDAEPRVDAIWCLGDLVDYGPSPNECIEALRLRNVLCIAGNHDRAATGDFDISLFNRDARAACRWTQKALTDSSREFLQLLRPFHFVDGIRLVHGSPRDPIFEYIFNLSVAIPNFDRFDAGMCLVGHTHVPLIFTHRDVPGGPPEYATVIPEPGKPVALKGLKSIVNPGGVGQPRDGDPRAAYMLLDPENLTVTLKRQSYDIAETQELMLRARLPDRLVERLAYGW